MSIRWEKLLGDSSAFAIKVAFGRDPDRGRGATPDLAESWGSFQIWVDGRNLCFHDEEDETVDSVHWYLLPLFEWFVDQWDALFHEERLPRRECQGADGWTALMTNNAPTAALSEDDELDWLGDWQGWWQRHCLQAARHGGHFPGIVFRRWRHQVEISWGSAGLVGAPDHFRFTHAGGYSRLEPKKVAEPLHRVLGEAIEQLAEWCPDSETILDLRNRHRELTQERTTPRLGWLAGIGPERWKTFATKLEQVVEAPRKAIDEILEGESTTNLVLDGSCRAALMFGSLSPVIGEADLVQLASRLVAAFAPERSRGLLDKLVVEVPTRTPGPWLQAYELAERTLRELNLWEATDTAVDVESCLETLEVEVTDIELGDTDTRGIAFVSPVHRATILVNRRHPANELATGRRFTLAHELCHLLFDRSGGRELALASGPWAPSDVEKRANAFAAMFLMPTSMIRRLVSELGPQPLRRDQVKTLAKAMETGFIATLEHLTNLGFVSRAEKQAIEAE